ncbi:phosphomannomutase [Magnetospira sp. QH-2]|uniref:phosphomannomutase n=1 Tax=Magnetospira sp. (strain QH-2) TaxID=1288970 RepID=UPI0005FA4EAF|nr:phosphomannomutase [Magnetospira sp. QH-2]
MQTINDLMDQSQVKFGTSGARGLVLRMTDRVCYTYTVAFLQHLRDQGLLEKGSEVALAGDLRPSTPRIMQAVARAIADQGLRPVNCGFIGSPAVAYFGLQRGIPSIMVTGSHIPDDRNGIKFNRADGEIAKTDEEGIRNQWVAVPEGLFDTDGAFADPPGLPDVDDTAASQYLMRYREFFPSECLKGLRIGVYEHSGVARDMLGTLLAQLGAEVMPLGRSDRFIPVDTEAIRPEDVSLAKAWAKEHELDAIVSTDGDADRPLLADETGTWFRGDVAGILCARFLGAKQVVTPVSSNSALEKCGWFERVVRTRIGSPYVIAGMEMCQASGSIVVGYEANGGFLIADSIEIDGRVLAPLPTRDAVLVPLALMSMAVQQCCKLSELLTIVPPRFTASDRLKDFPTELSLAVLEEFDGADAKAAIEARFGAIAGTVDHVDRTDGTRITFENLEIIHLRPSGNAPELRCYNEADSAERATEMNRLCLQIMETWRSQ